MQRASGQQSTSLQRVSRQQSRSLELWNRLQLWNLRSMSPLRRSKKKPQMKMSGQKQNERSGSHSFCVSMASPLIAIPPIESLVEKTSLGLAAVWMQF